MYCEQWDDRCAITREHQRDPVEANENSDENGLQIIV